MIFNALQAVLMVVLIIAIGYFVAYKGWADQKVRIFISKFIVNISLPCTIITAFLRNFTAQTLATSYIYIIASLISVIIIYGISKIIAKVAKIDPKKRGVFCALFSFSNSVFIGIPVALAIFGEAGIVFAVFYFVANTSMMNSVGFLDIQKDGALIRNEKLEKQSALSMIKRLLRPPIIAIILGFILVTCNVKLPLFLDTTLSYVGNITSPVSLIFIGIVLHKAGLSCLKRIDKGISIVAVGRFLIAPIIMFAVCRLFNIDSLASAVLLVQMSLPSMVQSAVFAEISGADTEFATKGLIFTTLVSFATIPIYVAMF